MTTLLDQADAWPTIPGYRILGRLGQGGQGAVFLAERCADGRKAAIKVLYAGAREARRRFQREIGLSRSFAHPNVVKILDGSLAQDQGDPWLAMEYLDGRTLGDAVGEGPLGEAFVRSVALDMARGLEYLHGRGLIHRDLKPANVFLQDGGRALLLDFGLATGDELTKMTATSDIPGTFVAMAPEQLLCQPLSPATDVYQLGFTLFVALTGQPPFAVDELVRGVSTGQWSEPPPPAASSGCSAEFAAFVLNCLQADAARRPADGAAVLALLEPPEAEDEPVQPRGRPVAPHEPVSVAFPRARPGRHRQIVGALCLVVAVVMVGLMALGARGPSSLPSSRPSVSTSVQLELLTACYGGPDGPDVPAVTAVLSELDALIDPAVDGELRSTLARDWRDAARSLAEDDPARALVEAALYLREGSRDKADGALRRALEGQRLLLSERGGSLTPVQLALETVLLGRWLALVLDADEPGRLHRLLDEGDRFVLALPPALGAAPAAATLRLVSLAARWVLWGRQGTVGAASREDAAPGLAAFGMGLPAAELAALPRWCARACDEAATLADPALLRRCADEAGARELAVQERAEALKAASRLNEINHDVSAVAGGRMPWVHSVADQAVRRLRRAYWLTLALAWRPETEPESASCLCFVASSVVEIRLRGRLSDVAVEGRWGDGFEPDVLMAGAMAALVRVLGSLPGLAGDAAVAAAVAEWLDCSMYRPDLVASSRGRLAAATAERPFLRALLAVVAASDAGDPSSTAAATAGLLRCGQSVLSHKAVAPDERAHACGVLAEGFRRGWFVLPTMRQYREAEAQATWLMEALDAPARAPGAPPSVRHLWCMAVLVVVNGRLAVPRTAQREDDRSRRLSERLDEVAAPSKEAGGDEMLRKIAAELRAGRPVWGVVGSGP